MDYASRNPVPNMAIDDLDLAGVKVIVLKALSPGLLCIVGLLHNVNINMCLLLIGQKSKMAANRKYTM